MAAKEIKLKKQPEHYWREKLTKEQYDSCRRGLTETPFTGEYNDNFEEGSYHCVACGHELFKSDKKIDVGSGWPTFWAAIYANIVEKLDNSLGFERIEIKCKKCGSHLGHLFWGGPEVVPDGRETTGRRYYINSASLTFEQTK